MGSKNECIRCGGPLPDWCGARNARYVALCDRCNEEVAHHTDANAILTQRKWAQEVWNSGVKQLPLFDTEAGTRRR